MFRPALWAVGLVTWVAVTWVTVALLPSEPGPFSERPFAKAVLIGGAFGVSMMAIDLWRHPRRLWLWGCCAWGVILCLSAWSGAFGDDSDIDQILGWGVFLGGVIGIPLIFASVISWIWKRGNHAIQARPRRWRVKVGDRSLEIARRKNPPE